MKKFDQFLNERDLEGWNSLLLFDEDKDDQEMMDVREEAKMKREYCIRMVNKLSYT